ncbi:nucleoid-associated protein [Sphingobacterium sp. UT-1RO-CII-1]|uniref:nucleoid-associated protein n=1 Tax=Sphingobacterium sp. UT-1RO-CII-1 TaxID=2995225 RepID=UPI002DD445C2|nr:nucleoid-associated protein [Sphingobacterium sp. UT-1RO-CII-1]
MHRVGNKANDEFYVLSETPLTLNEKLEDLFSKYLLVPFMKTNEVYNFYHLSCELNLNEVFNFVNRFLDGPEEICNEPEFHELSKNIAKHLYECTDHPKLKGGELYVAYIEGVQFEGEIRNAIGVFKSENKQSFLKVSPVVDGFSVDFESEAINIDKLDKGVIILDTDSCKGYDVLVIDGTSISESIIWKDDFLKVVARNDSYQQTSNVLKVYKNFVVDKIDEVFDLETADKIDLLNRSMHYFKNKETFDSTEFEEEVIQSDKAIELFQEYKKEFVEDFEVSIDESFPISNSAVKKMQTTYKSVIKLDKNFLIQVNGKREYLEKGYDEVKDMNYYKLYYDNES